MALESDSGFEKECDDFSITSSLDTPRSPCSNMLTPRVHPQYYLKDDLSVFLVDNEVLFRVHRHLLDRESAVFRSFPTGTVENPVRLEEARPDEFVALLEYFYDGVHGNAPRPSEQWIYLLSISDQFEMEKLHNRAIWELEFTQLDPVDKIVLAVDHNVPEWLDPAYIELCKREDPLQEEEAEKLGLKMTVKLYRAREKIRTSAQVVKALVPKKSRSPVCWEPEPEDTCFGALQGRDGSSTASQTFDDVHIAKIIADIFHSEKPTPDISTPDISIGNPDCLPTLPDDSETQSEQYRKPSVVVKKKGRAKK